MGNSIYSRVAAGWPDQGNQLNKPLASPVDKPMIGPLNNALPTGMISTRMDVLMAAQNKAAADQQELAKNRAQYENEMQMGPQGWQQKVRQTEAQAQAAYRAFVAEAKRQGMGMFIE
jgi:hypothetical protein